MAKEKLTDPVEKAGELAEEDAEFDSLDVSNIKVEVLPDDAARAKRPFDGYPVKKIKIEMKETDKRTGKQVMVPKVFNATDWVLHNGMAHPVHQDPSNRKRKTYHNRSIKDVLGNNNVPNISIQFSAPIRTANGIFYGALVPNPYIRAQLIFTQEKKSGRLMVDKRYLLLDTDQKSRLKQCFLQLIGPQIEMERAADFISSASKIEPSGIKEIEPGATEL